MPTTPIRILQISDAHLFADPTRTFYGLNTENSFLATLEQIRSSQFKPDICLLTGDLTQDHSVDAYIRIAQHLSALTCQIYWLPGNHDIPDMMTAALAQTQLHAEKTILIKNWQLILLNSHKPKSAAGFLSKTELDFLETQLKEHPTHYACIVLHHHPIKMGSTWLDTVGLENAEDFFAIIDKYPQVRSIVFGHVHQESHHERNNICLMSTPSTCFQFLPHSTPFALDINAHPGYRQIELFENGQLKTDVIRVKNFKERPDPDKSGYTEEDL